MAKPLNIKGDLTNHWIYWRWKDSESKTLMVGRVICHFADSNILEVRRLHSFDKDLVNKEEIDIFRVEDENGNCVSDKFVDEWLKSSFDSCFKNWNASQD